MTVTPGVQTLVRPVGDGRHHAFDAPIDHLLVQAWHQRLVSIFWRRH
jgi:hypothetical protein